MQLELTPATLPAAERAWSELPRAPSTFFTSWGWMENWLASLPREHQPLLAVARSGDRTQAAFFLARRNALRLGVVASRALHFNTTGVPSFDNLTIEYNGPAGVDLSIGKLVDLLPADWDELFLPALRCDAFGGVGETTHRGFHVRIERSVPAYHVDLARVREAGYLALLGGQTRAQVRRARREAGDLEVEVATDEVSALSIYTDLVRLHQAQWRAKGEPGAWADPWFDRFHRRLIARRFRHGEIQLLCVRNASGTLGALYNFVDRGRVLQYQSGVAQIANNHLKPGFLAHAAAIEHNAAQGHALYDFLGGDVRYKRSLSTASTPLVWARVQRQRLRFLVEDRLRDWARARRLRDRDHGVRSPA